MFYHQCPFLVGCSDLLESYTGFCEQAFRCFAFAFCDLKHHCRVLGKEDLDQIGLTIGYECVRGQMHSTGGVGERHFKQCGDKTSCRNVMPRHDGATFHQSLNGIEGCREFSRILDGGCFRADTAEGLGECRSAETKFIAREVNIIQT